MGLARAGHVAAIALEEHGAHPRTRPPFYSAQLACSSPPSASNSAYGLRCRVGRLAGARDSLDPAHERRRCATSEARTRRLIWASTNVAFTATIDCSGPLKVERLLPRVSATAL